MQEVYLLRLMPQVGLIMFGLNFVSPHQSKAKYILTTMNEELLASALLVQSGALLVSQQKPYPSGDPVPLTYLCGEEKIYLVEVTILKISRSGPSLCCLLSNLNVI
jgi:hypothetical protein